MGSKTVIVIYAKNVMTIQVGAESAGRRRRLRMGSPSGDFGIQSCPVGPNLCSNDAIVHEDS